MSDSPFTSIYTARLSIEFTTPFHIGSGDTDDASDAGVVCDANGLPAIPGSSIQGVLRSACKQAFDDPNLLFDLFGRSDQDATTSRQAHAAKLNVSWGHIHNQKNIPVTGLLLSDEIIKDKVLSNALTPTLRDHVRMTHRKVANAEENGKFDELVICAGHRFTFELICTDTNQSLKKSWEKLIQLLKSPDTRFGGKTRRGLGAFKIISLKEHHYNLQEEEQRNAWLKHSPELSTLLSDSAVISPDQSTHSSDSSQTYLTLTPETPWMFGGGYNEDADSAPVKDFRIIWEKDGEPLDQPYPQECYVIPGSSVKGALSHRTCFHANLSHGIFADELNGKPLESVTGENNETIKAIFGQMAEDDEGNQLGRPGLVFIDDVFIPAKEITPLPPQSHVAIDPFTGGAKEGALFNDQPLPSKNVSIRIPISIQTENLGESDRQALKKALDDLCEGRLSLGAHAGRGYGFFTGSHNLIF